MGGRWGRLHEAAEAVIASAWEGGVRAALADYATGRCSVVAVAQRTGLSHRAVRGVLRANGVEPRKGETCGEWLRDARPDRQALFQSDPTRNANAIAPMTLHEAAFADVLRGAGLGYEFNPPVASYWLDFHVPSLRIGFEVHNTSRVGRRDRDATIQASLGLRTILYIPNNLLSDARRAHVAALVAAVATDGQDLPSAIGDHRHLRLRPREPHVEWRGFRFQNEWDLAVARFRRAIDARFEATDT